MHAVRGVQRGQHSWREVLPSPHGSTARCWKRTSLHGSVDLRASGKLLEQAHPPTERPYLARTDPESLTDGRGCVSASPYLNRAERIDMRIQKAAAVRSTSFARRARNTGYTRPSRTP